MKIRLPYPGPARKVAFAALIALALPVLIAALAPTAGLAVVVINGILIDHLEARP